MEKQRKKQIKKVTAWVTLAAVVILLACLPMIAANEKVETGPQASILSVKAENRSLSQVILGGGSLTAEEAVTVTIPAQVKVTEYLISNGDLVVQGQPIASVDRVSVMSAISQVQETLDYLAEELDAVRNDTGDTKVTATAGGRVKIIYGTVGEQVQDVILRNGALAVLSLDGMMAVQIERYTDLSGGDTVCVTLEDDTEVTGRVESNLEGVLTVTLEDKGYAVGETVKVTDEEGNRIGSGELYIHSPWNVVAYSGTISAVRVSEEETVTAGKQLFSLEDTGHTAQFDSLSRQRREYEQLMLELFRMYQSETVAAPQDGIITGVDASGSYMLSHNGTGWHLDLLMNAPNGDDETTYVNYIGQVSQVGIDGLILKMNPQPLFITDYMDLSDVPMDVELMSEDAIYNADAPFYELEEGVWVQIEATEIRQDDILLFAGDAEGNFVWVVRVETTSEEPEVPEETQPVQPENPGATPDSGESGMPSNPGQSGGFPNMGGGGFSGMGGMTQEEVFELYGLDTVTIASVIPQEILTVQIQVDELDITKIYLGQSVDLTVDALMGETFAGTVTAISGSGTNEGGNSKFTVDITVNKASDMLPGMTAYATITLATTENVLCIPVAALTESGTETIVYTGYDEKKETFTGPITVTVGLSDGEYAQILSGLGEGQEIYYPYYDTLVISNAPRGSASSSDDADFASKFVAFFLPCDIIKIKTRREIYVSGIQSALRYHGLQPSGKERPSASGSVPGSVAQFWRHCPVRHYAADVLHRFRQRHYPFRPGQQLRPSGRCRRNQFRPDPERRPGRLPG